MSAEESVNSKAIKRAASFPLPMFMATLLISRHHVTVAKTANGIVGEMGNAMRLIATASVRKQVDKKARSHTP